MSDEGSSEISLDSTVTRRSVLAFTLGGLATAPLPSTNASAQQSRKWYFEMSGAATTPTVVDGTVFAGSHLGLHAIDVENGVEQWFFRTDCPFDYPPAVVDNTAFIGCRDGNLYAINAETGERQWTFQAYKPISWTNITIAGNTVFIGGNDSLNSPQNKESTLYAVDAESGTEMWTFKTGGNFSSPAVVDDTVFIASQDIYAVDAEDGTQQWSVEKQAFHSSPTVADGIVHIGSVDNQLYSFRAETGDQLWTFETSGSVGPPTESDGTVLVGCEDNNLYAVDAKSGEKQWEFETKNSIISSPTTVDHTVFVASNESLYAVDAETGKEIWTFDLRVSSGSSSPIVVDGTIFIGGTLLNALDAKVSGSSDDSRVMLGTFGHHNSWRYAGQSIDTSSLVTNQHLDVFNSKPVQFIGGTVLLTGTLAAGVGVKKWRHKSSSSEISETAATINTPEVVPSPPRYELDYTNITKQGMLGAGGNADVYGATAETADGTLTFALKEPRLSGTISSDRVDRLLSEAETWASLDDHDHIVSIIDYGSDPLPWIAMEYMDGGHLAARANEFGTNQSLWIALAVTRGVRHAHRRGIAHLDLKPENILFRSIDDGWDVPKVADWGLSKHLLDHSHSREGLSPHYAAPEQFDEEVGPTDERTDIYQLGAVFYGLFTGKPPFKGSTASVMQDILTTKPKPPTKLNDSLPSEVDGIIQKAMAKERGNRYESIIYFRDAVENLIEKHGI